MVSALVGASTDDALSHSDPSLLQLVGSRNFRPLNSLNQSSIRRCCPPHPPPSAAALLGADLAAAAGAPGSRLRDVAFSICSAASAASAPLSPVGFLAMCTAALLGPTAARGRLSLHAAVSSHAESPAWEAEAQAGVAPWLAERVRIMGSVGEMLEEFEESMKVAVEEEEKQEATRTTTSSVVDPPTAGRPPAAA